jgi:hypothetical protein
MGIRGELFSTRVLLENRTYFFNVKENRMGDLYLNIVESKNREATAGFDRQSVILFAEDLQDFLRGFDESLRVMEKAVRERKRAGIAKAPREGGRERGGEGYERRTYEQGGRDYGKRGHGESRDYGRREGGGSRDYGSREQGGSRDYGSREQGGSRDYGSREHGEGRNEGRRERGSRDYGSREQGGSRNYGSQGRKDREHDTYRAGRGPSGSPEEKNGPKRPRRMVVKKSRQDD